MPTISLSCTLIILVGSLRCSFLNARFEDYWAERREATAA